ncbi:hypothetical protein XcvCFBP7111P_23225 [Xanthomonas citri pv. vignicola]|uniref:Uncharacterized protein n=1 Tax=Xanthomonas citri pv. vignicola TaxID=473426 RepID=A0AB33CTD1_XANCI|nr:hypothetical protein XcvCFBP7111P_23225 [Xanthomonas citri pv. vignicola]
MSATMRHWVAASAGDLHSLALRDAFPGAADRSVTVPMPLPIACLPKLNGGAGAPLAGESSS